MGLIKFLIIMMLMMDWCSCHGTVKLIILESKSCGMESHCTLESWLADWVFHIFVVKNVAFCLKMWLRGWNETYQKLSILILDRSLVKLDFNFQLYSVFERFFQFSPRGHFKRKYRQNLASSGGNILVSFETQIYYGDFDVWHGNIHQFEAGLTKQKRLSKEDKGANDLCKTTYIEAKIFYSLASKIF